MLAARAYFVLCLALGRMLRSARYSTVRIVHRDGQRLVRKHRRFYAPFLIWMSGLLVRVLDTGVRVLPQREWEQRERRIYRSLYDTSIGVERRRSARPAISRWTHAGDVAGGSGTGGVDTKEGDGTCDCRPCRVPSPGTHPRRRDGRERSGRSRGRCRLLV